MQQKVRNGFVSGGVVAAVAVAWFGTTAVMGLVHERDMLRDQVGALSRRTARPAVPPSAAPASASPEPTGRSGGVPPGVVVVQRVIRITRPQPAQPAPAPHRSPSPPPSPSPRPATCPTAQVVTVRAPAGVLRCGTVQVAHIATIGGTR